MAKKAGVNKTQAVAEYLKAHPKAKSTEIAEALTNQGLTITRGHVANIKSKLKRMRQARRRGATKPVAVSAGTGAGKARRAAPSASAAPEKTPLSSDAITLEEIKKVAQTVKAIGGFERLHEMLSVIKEVGGLKKFKDLLDAMSLSDTGIPF